MISDKRVPVAKNPWRPPVPMAFAVALLLCAYGHAQSSVLLEGVSPDSGPMAGGEPVTILGDFGTIDTISEAESLYRVTFGHNVADFDDVDIKVVARARALYVVTPPQGFAVETAVDVWVELASDPADFDVLISGYTYTPSEEPLSCAPHPLSSATANAPRRLPIGDGFLVLTVIALLARARRSERVL